MLNIGHSVKIGLLALSLSSTLWLYGCSISDSVGSISRSSESFSDSSKSSSKSSEGDSKTVDNNVYENEVKDFTATYLRTNPNLTDRDSFMKGISDVASQHGIVDWEANPKTYRGIGKGLKKAKISDAQYELYKKKFSDGDHGKMDDIQEGYEGSH